MLRRIRMFRTPRLPVPWWIPAAGWAVFAVLILATARFDTDDKWVLVFAGVCTVLSLRHVGQQVAAHHSRHGRRDRQHDVMASVMRFTFTHDGTPVPPALDDERQQQPGVVQFRPRGAPRHSRPRSRRHNA